MTVNVNIDAVAAACGFSTATVSRVFNRRGNVQVDTRDKVLAAARKLGWTPTVTASRDCLAVVVEDFAGLGCGGYHMMLLAALCGEAARRGWRIELLPAAELPVLGGKFVHGAVSCLYHPASLAALAPRRDLPLVTVNAVVPGIPAVVTDEAQGMELAVEHLAERGHRRIALLAKQEGNHSNDARRAGFRAAMAAAGLAVPAWAEPDATDDWAPVVTRVIDRGATALIAAAEELGPGVASILHRQGFRIGERIALVGYEHQGVSDLLHPPQTTIAQDFTVLATQAMELVAKGPSLRRRGAPAPVVSVPCSLRIRGST